MSSEDTTILKIQCQTSDRVFYADLECSIEKTDGCKNNSENSSTAKEDEHTPSGFSMSTTLSLKGIENHHDVYRGKHCMKMFCGFLRMRAMKIINFKNKKNKAINKVAARII